MIRDCEKKKRMQDQSHQVVVNSKHTGVWPHFKAAATCVAIEAKRIKFGLGFFYDDPMFIYGNVIAVFSFNSVLHRVSHSSEQP